MKQIKLTTKFNVFKATVIASFPHVRTELFVVTTFGNSIVFN